MTTPDELYTWASDLFPINRSLTGDGVRQTLRYIQSIAPDLSIHEVPTGTVAFDWTVLNEWNIRTAYLEHESGQKFAEFSKCNLHVVGYSEPTDLTLSLDDLQPHLHSLPDIPDAIPYVTYYYKRDWGFALSHNQRIQMPAGDYHVVIESTLTPGHLTYGEVVIPGSSQEEVILSTNICHPSLANNEISGPVVTTALVKWLKSLPERRCTYRVVFVPETIGAIVYINRHFDQLRKNVIAGFVLTCMGDERAWSFVPSRQGNTLADKVARHILNHKTEAFTEYSFLERGSDERQYCSPKVDLPVCSIMRSKYGTYPEYHTSDDNLALISPHGLHASFELYKECIFAIEKNHKPIAKHPCEPQLGKHGLYPLFSKLNSTNTVNAIADVLTYCDGEHDLIDIAELIGKPYSDVFDIVDLLYSKELIQNISHN